MSKTMGAKASDVLQDKTVAIQIGRLQLLCTATVVERVDASTKDFGLGTSYFGLCTWYFGLWPLVSLGAIGE